MREESEGDDGGHVQALVRVLMRVYSEAVH